MRSASAQFGWFTEDEARAKAAESGQNGDTYGDRLVFRRRLAPVTTPAERARARAYRPGKSYKCVGCGRHSFPRPGVRCYWCKRYGEVRE